MECACGTRERGKGARKNLVGKPKGNWPLESDGSIILQWIFKKALYRSYTVKQSLEEAWWSPEGSRSLGLPEFLNNRHMKVICLSAIRTGRLYHPGDTPGTHFCKRSSRTQDHSVVGRIRSMKNLNEPIGNRTRNLPACSAVPQPNACTLIKEISTRKPKFYFIHHS